MAGLALLTLKCTLILAAAFAAAGLLRRQPAALRHALWATVLASALALPALTAAMPAWSLPLLPSPQAHPAGEPPAAAARSAVDPAQASRAIRAGGTPPDPAGTLQAPRDHGDGAGLLTGSSLAWLLWGTGAALVLLRLLAGSLRMARMARAGVQLTTGPATDLLREISAALGLERPVRLVVSRATQLPFTWGWLRPVILLPHSAGGWGGDRLKIVLTHELVHIRRRHWPLQILAALASALHWFNPLVWMAARRLEAEREMSCDEAVLEQGTRPSDYATHLVEIARTISSARTAPAAGLSMARPPALERRLVMILKPNAAPSGRRAAALLLAGLTLAVLPVAAVQPWAEPARQAAAGIAVPAAAASSYPVTVTSWSQHVSDGHGGTSMMIGRSNGDLMLSKDVDGVDLRIHMEEADAVEMARDGRSILRMGPNSHVVIRTSLDGSDQRLEIESGRDGEPVYDWSVDGRRRPFDREAREWMALTLEIGNGLWEAGSLRGQHSSLRGQISSTRGHVSSLKGQISSIRGRRSSLRGQISSIRGKVSSMRGEISSIRGRESSMRGRISSLRGKISSLEAQKSREGGYSSSRRRELAREINAEIDREIESLEAQIEEAEADLRAYDTDALVREVEERLESFDAEARIAEVEEELSRLDVEGEVERIEDEIEEYDQEGRIRELEEEIRRLAPLEKADEIMERTERLYPELRRMVRGIGGTRREL